MFDIIIVGAGSAGCVLANRLSHGGVTKVLLLEAGGADDRSEVKIPAAFSKMFHTEVDWDFTTEPEAAVDDRQMYWPRGKMLGGSSSLNAMMYVRGHRSDYDQWRQLGNAGWGYDDVLPYFKRSEGFVGRHAADGYHGTDGPVVVSDQRSPNPMTASFIEAGLALGLKRNDDVNGPVQAGIGYTHVTQLKGQRRSAADGFLRPAMTRPNLQVETHCLVENVVVEHGRATAVTYRQNGESKTAQAAHSIIIAAGAVGSPQILMLSGIGPAAHLREHGIAVVADLPGVGGNLQDHLASGVSYHASNVVSLASAQSLPNLMRYLLIKRGPLTSNVGEAVAFLHSRAGLAAPDIELIFAPAFFVGHGAGNPEGHGFTIASVLLRPDSRGSIRLKSTDPAVKPAIHGNYLATNSDRDTLRAGVRFARKIARQHVFDSIRGEEFMPGSAAESDAALDAAIRERCETLYHPIGTCKMGSDASAVVDATLRVRGIEGLRVVDASVMPTLIGGHTHAPTMMIAEKAADMIRAAGR